MKTMTSLVLVDIIQENACSFQFVENLHLKSNDLSSVISQGQSTRLFVQNVAVLQTEHLLSEA